MHSFIVVDLLETISKLVINLFPLCHEFDRERLDGPSTANFDNSLSVRVDFFKGSSQNFDEGVS